MKVFVTGVGGQLGYDVMNELRKRGHEAIGSDIHPEYRAAGAEPCCHAETVILADAFAVQTIGLHRIFCFSFG